MNCMCSSRPAVSDRSAPVFVLHFPASALFCQFVTAKSTVWMGRTSNLRAGARRPEEARDWDHSVCTVGHSGNSAGSPVAIFNLISSRSCWRKTCQVCVCVCVCACGLSSFTVKVKETGSLENLIQRENCLSVASCKENRRFTISGMSKRNLRSVPVWGSPTRWGWI